MSNKTAYDNARKLLITAIILGGLSLIGTFVSTVMTKHWAKNRNIVACVPADIEHTFPNVYHQTAFNPTTNEAFVKSFVYKYVEFSQNEQIVDYHRLTNNSRYKYNLLSESKRMAVNMSVGTAEIKNKERYSKSPDVYETLKKGNMGWIFLPDSILLKFIPQSGVYLAIVRGQFQVSNDKAKNPAVPHALWGYKEIHLLVQQGTSRGDKVNKYGLYVSDEKVYTLTSKQKQKYQERNYEHYLSTN
jgi:hypothetical protein